MTEPVSIASSSVIAAFAAGFLQLVGIDMPPVIWACIGAAFAQGYSDVEISRFRVAVHILGGGMLGALMGTVFASFFPEFAGLDHRHLVFMLAAVGGFGAQPIMQTLLTKIVKKLEGNTP
jgi:hypothetical protein